MYASTNLPLEFEHTHAQIIEYITPLLNTNNSGKIIFHSINFAKNIGDFCKTNTALLVSDKSELNGLIVASYFYIIGFHIAYNNPLESSLNALEDFAKKYNLEVATYAYAYESLQGLIEETKNHTPFPKTFKELIWLYPIINDFDTSMSLLRAELQLVKDEDMEEAQWIDFQLQYLLAHSTWNLLSLQTIYASKRELIISHLLSAQRNLKLQQELKTAKKTKDVFLENPDLSLYERLEQNAIPNKGLQTFWRTAYPVHIQLSSIADNKANMMISINSILLTLILASFSVGLTNINEIKAGNYLLPMICLILTALSSLLIAVLSVLPKLTNTLTTLQKEEKSLKNIIFFGNFVQPSAEEYAKEIQKLFENTDTFYNSMSKELYNLGIILHSKYRLLRISYGIFFIGLMISALSFLIALSI